MNKTFIAIDGGATKTAMTVCDADGFEIYAATSPGSNFQAIGEENVVEVLTNLLTDAANNIHDWNIDAAVFAIAGVDTKTDLQIVTDIVKRSIAASPLKIGRYVVENDVEATLKGLTKNLPGALLISGTGAIAFGYNGENFIRTGGWGHRVGDEGSGYWIGQQIGHAIFKAADGRGNQTILTELVLQHLQLTTIDQLYTFLYNDTYTNSHLAGLSSTLQQACEVEDAVALEIATLAANELALLAETILKGINSEQAPLPFYINGGVLKNNACIYDRFLLKMQQNYPHIQFELCQEQPLYYLAKRVLLLKTNVNL